MLFKIICLKDLSYRYILAFLNLQVELRVLPPVKDMNTQIQGLVLPCNLFVRLCGFPRFACLKLM